jgi:hypothetical protein
VGCIAHHQEWHACHFQKVIGEGGGGDRLASTRATH